MRTGARSSAASHRSSASKLRESRGVRAPALFCEGHTCGNTGLRAAEMKALRRCDLRLNWKDGIVVSGEVVVPISKTESGKRRTKRPRLPPCTRRAARASRKLIRVGHRNGHNHGAVRVDVRCNYVCRRCA